VSPTTTAAAPPNSAQMMGHGTTTLDKMIGAGMTLASFQGGPETAIHLANVSFSAMAPRSEGLMGKINEP